MLQISVGVFGSDLLALRAHTPESTVITPQQVESALVQTRCWDFICGHECSRGAGPNIVQRLQIVSSLRCAFGDSFGASLWSPSSLQVAPRQ